MSMKTFPNMPYPGRGILIGNQDGNPAFCYFVTVRTPKYRGRKLEFVKGESAYRTLPFRKEDFDSLLHYRAVTIDKETGLLMVSNSEAPVGPLMESYKIFLTAEIPAPLTLNEITEDRMMHIGPEPDEIKTPRILSIFYTGDSKSHEPFVLLSTTGKGFENVANRKLIHTVRNRFDLLTTYCGDFNNAIPFNPGSVRDLPFVEMDGTTPQQLTEEIYNGLYADTPKGDLRVCTIAGVHTNDNWNIAFKNRFDTQEEFDTFLAETERK